MLPALILPTADRLMLPPYVCPLEVIFRARIEPPCADRLIAPPVPVVAVVSILLAKLRLPAPVLKLTEPPLTLMLPVIF